MSTFKLVLIIVAILMLLFTHFMYNQINKIEGVRDESTYYHIVLFTITYILSPIFFMGILVSTIKTFSKHIKK